MDNKKEDYSYNTAYHTRRIADILEEILRLVKKDQEDSAARQRQWDAEKK